MVSKIEINKEKITRSIAALWQSFTDKQYQILLNNITVRRFKKSEMIYKDFERPTYAMCLIQGKVKIFKNGIGGRSQIVRVIKPIEFFSYRAAFAHEDYKTSAMSFENCIIAFFPIQILEKFMSENFEICDYFIQRLAKELGIADDRTLNLTQKHIRGRLAEALLYLKDSYGIEEDGSTLSIYLSREDLANLSNMTTSNAIRTLSAFANEKLIAIDGRKIKIIKEQVLRKISRTE
ncbi:MAG: Crp/Fnr family transcriptional regulator [Prevotella sp.]|jgi:CRP-like cAMP-binding protein|nr:MULTISPECIES: Crp/Fnr family transcriptional regulator [unclassified Prevotella]MCH3970415.1 Crp/Fnr family transcriptional regulator [Prevotella sp.]MCH3991072.1 Crp/Fnr family transcriptional regulator [Prevotella sp.]MCH4018211.1 Crp/Fnr family transcriptional regulator [Prevotella sp.]MCH4100529.1 Crp/Fnr family transcriptional regulator [Prevotella sp.]MCH4185569.1 Crp/Fnr family transcriptional regulator [Prevotella sp.]